MPFIIPANTLASGGFEVANSCRFNGSNDSLVRTVGTAGNRKTFTISTWIKKSKDAVQQIIGQATANGYFRIIFKTGTTNKLYVYGNNDAENNSFEVYTNRLFNDSAAWMHIVVRMDTTQGTASDRLRIYINGIQETSFTGAVYPSQDWSTHFHTTQPHNIGASASGGDYFNGYMSEIISIDGSSLDATSFGEFDEDSGIWKPIDGLADDLTFGTNGFYLDFKDSSALGDDVSGNGNDFTVNNLTAIDQSTDTCTNNFCTINPLVNGTERNPTLSEGNVFLTNTSNAWMNCMSSFAASSGKWYFEIKPTLHGTSYVHAGIFAVDDWQHESSGYPNFGGTANSWSYDSDGNIVNNDENEDTNPATYTTNNIIGIAVDLDNNKFYAYKNNALQISGGSTITANTEYYFGGMGYNSNIGFNFGNPSYANTSDAADGNGYGAFEFAPPSGFFALNTKNLAEYG